MSNVFVMIEQQVRLFPLAFFQLPLHLYPGVTASARQCVCVRVQCAHRHTRASTKAGTSLFVCDRWLEGLSETLASQWSEPTIWRHPSRVFERTDGRGGGVSILLGTSMRDHHLPSGRKAAPWKKINWIFWGWRRSSTQNAGARGREADNCCWRLRFRLIVISFEKDDFAAVKKKNLTIAWIKYCLPGA